MSVSKEEKVVSCSSWRALGPLSNATVGVDKGRNGSSNVCRNTNSGIRQLPISRGPRQRDPWSCQQASKALLSPGFSPSRPPAQRAPLHTLDYKKGCGLNLNFELIWTYEPVSVPQLAKWGSVPGSAINQMHFRSSSRSIKPSLSTCTMSVWKIRRVWVYDDRDASFCDKYAPNAEREFEPAQAENVSLLVMKSDE